ncbi:MAG: WbqC family protein [Cyclobacteriaceae bacterium]
MKVAIMQPYFFPYLGYFQLMKISNIFVFYDDVNFIKGGWVNRNRILNSSTPLFINAHIKGSSSNKKINEIGLNLDSKWRRKLLKTLIHSYGRAPFFNEVQPFIEMLVMHPAQYISEFNIHILTETSRQLGLPTVYFTNSERFEHNMKSGQDRVLDICIQLQASTYTNLINGKSLYRREDFELNGIDLNFLEMNSDLSYAQFGNPFISKLSIIDVLMFNGFSGTQTLLEKYTLIK